MTIYQAITNYYQQKCMVQLMISYQSITTSIGIVVQAILATIK